MAAVNSTPTPRPTKRRATTKASECIPAYGASAGVLSFRHGLAARECRAIDRALAIVGRFLQAPRYTFASPHAVKLYLQLHLAGEAVEQFAVLFLDVQMPDMLGTDFARLLKNTQTQIVFVTAYPDYAVEGFALQALDYLLKPVEFSRFLQACNRALGQLPKKAGEPSSIFVKDGYDWVRVNLDEILYIQSDSNLLFIHEHSRKITTRMTLNEMLAQLPTAHFLRVHKSYLVALKAIQKMERHQVTVGNVTIPLAGSYKAELEERLLK